MFLFGIFKSLKYNSFNFTNCAISIWSNTFEKSNNLRYCNLVYWNISNFVFFNNLNCFKISIISPSLSFLTIFFFFNLSSNTYNSIYMTFLNNIFVNSCFIYIVKIITNLNNYVQILYENVKIMHI